MLYFRQNYDKSPEGVHHAAQQTVGQLGLYRESPVRMIVRIVDARVIKPGPNDARLEVEFEVQAAHCPRENFPMPPSGTRSTVCCPVSGGHPVWSIELLDASAVEDAIPEAEKRMGGMALTWER